jgi:hypothetical protein
MLQRTKILGGGGVTALTAGLAMISLNDPGFKLWGTRLLWVSGVLGVWAVLDFLHHHFYSGPRDETLKHIQDFNNALGAVVPHLDSNWAACAKGATWPRGLVQDYHGGLAAWCALHAGAMTGANAALMEVARDAYRSGDALGEDWHLKSRLQMRESADKLACLGESWIPLARDLIRKRLKRESVLMCVYLEAALAEKLAQLHREPDIMTEWALLGKQHPWLTQPNKNVPSFADLPRKDKAVDPGLPRITDVEFGPEAKGEQGFRLLVRITAGDRPTSLDDWRVNLTLQDGTTVDRLVGQIADHKIAAGERTTLTIHFPFRHPISDKGALVGATLNGLDAKDARLATVRWTPAPSETRGYWVFPPVQVQVGPTPTDDAEQELNVHVTSILGLLSRDQEQYSEHVKGHLFVLSCEITNRTERSMSLEFGVALRLQEQGLIEGSGREVALRRFAHKDERRFHRGVWLLPASQTQAKDLTFLLDAFHTTASRGVDNIARDGHTLTITDWVTKRKLFETFTLFLAEPSDQNAAARSDAEIAFDNQIGLLGPEQREALLTVVRKGFLDVGDAETSPIRDVERLTDFLVRAPKHNSITRYRVNPDWPGPLTRWAERLEPSNEGRPSSEDAS